MPATLAITNIGQTGSICLIIQRIESTIRDKHQCPIIKHAGTDIKVITSFIRQGQASGVLTDQPINTVVCSFIANRRTVSDKVNVNNVTPWNSSINHNLICKDLATVLISKIKIKYHSPIITSQILENLYRLIIRILEEIRIPFGTT